MDSIKAIDYRQMYSKGQIYQLFVQPGSVKCKTCIKNIRCASVIFRLRDELKEDGTSDINLSNVLSKAAKGKLMSHFEEIEKVKTWLVDDEDISVDDFSTLNLFYLQAYLICYKFSDLETIHHGIESYFYFLKRHLELQCFF